MTRTLLRAAALWTGGPLPATYTPGALAFAQGEIVYAGPDAADLAARLSIDEVIDLPERLLMPGLVNTHTHSAMTYLRGLLDDLPSAEWFRREQVLEAKLTSEDCYWSALLCCCELIRNGVTCVADRFSF